MFKQAPGGQKLDISRRQQMMMMMTENDRLFPDWIAFLPVPDIASGFYQYLQNPGGAIPSVPPFFFQALYQQYRFKFGFYRGSRLYEQLRKIRGLFVQNL